MTQSRQYIETVRYGKYFMKTLSILVGVFLVVSMTINLAAFAGGHNQAQPKVEAVEIDIVEVAVSTGSFNTLVAAAQSAELVDALKGDGPMTLFAPTDEAFAALPEGTVEDLLKPENQAQLQAVLLYHVIPGKVMALDIKGTVNVETLEGSTVVVVANNAWSKKNKKITVNGANVITTDVEASNGVIHVIDAVILPPGA
jgi:uncharacterized surface protein with fasciclin (FAS1) repeats